MNPVTVYSDEQRGYWAGHDARVVVFTSPADPPGCIPCPAIVTRVVEDGRAFDVVRVAWQPDEVEVAHLARGAGRSGCRRGAVSQRTRSRSRRPARSRAPGSTTLRTVRDGRCVMAVDQLTYSGTLDVITCGVCGIPHAIPTEFHKKALRNHYVSQSRGALRGRNANISTHHTRGG